MSIAHCLCVVVVLGACVESNKTRRAAVGPAPAAEPPRAGKTGEGEDQTPVPARSQAPTPRSPSGTPAAQVYGPANHPFKGVALGAFPLETSDERSQLTLTAKKPYFRIFKLAGEEDAQFVWPLVRNDATMRDVCKADASPRHALYSAFESTYCKAGTSDAVKLSYELASKLAQTLNNGLEFRAGPYFDGQTLRQRVFPNPHWHELSAVCADEVKETSGTLIAWCREFMANKSAHEKKGIAYFNSAAEATAMASRFAALYGVKGPQ